MRDRQVVGFVAVLVMAALAFFWYREHERGKANVIRIPPIVVPQPPFCPDDKCPPWRP